MTLLKKESGDILSVFIILFKKNDGPHILTRTEDFRPGNFTPEVKFVVESDVHVEKTQTLHLDLNN